MKPTQPFPVIEAFGVSALFLATIAVLAFWQLDLAIASRWAFDAATGQFRAHGSFWANEVLHKGGRDFVIVLAVAALCCALLGRLSPVRYPTLHRQAGTIIGAVVGMGLTVLLVGVFKRYSHMDCPWDLVAYGGKDPYVSLFAKRPTGLPSGGLLSRGACGNGVCAVLALLRVPRDASALRSFRAWSGVAAGCDLWRCPAAARCTLPVARRVECLPCLDDRPVQPARLAVMERTPCGAGSTSECDLHVVPAAGAAGNEVQA